MDELKPLSAQLEDALQEGVLYHVLDKGSLIPAIRALKD